MLDIIPTSTTEVILPARSLRKAFDYASLGNLDLAERLLEIRDRVIVGESMIHMKAFEIGELLIMARDQLGDNFKRWCETELTGIGKSTLYNYINFYEVFAKNFPTVGKYRLSDLYTVAGKQCDTFRPELLSRMESGEISNSAELRQEIRAKKASREMAHRITTAGKSEIKSGNGALELDSKMERAVELLSLFTEPELAEIFDLLKEISIDQLRERFSERLRISSL